MVDSPPRDGVSIKTPVVVTLQSLYSCQRALTLSGWFERASHIVKGYWQPKSKQSHSSISGSWTGMQIALIGRQYGTDPYNSVIEDVISIEEVS